MNQIDDIKLIVIFNREKFGVLRDEFITHCPKNNIVLEQLLNTDFYTEVELKFKVDESLSKYSVDFINKLSLINIKEEFIHFEHSNIWIRNVDHLYPNHLELEIAPSLYFEIKKDFYFKSSSFNNWIKHLGISLDAKIIYILENFEKYHLKWFIGKEYDIILGDIDCFDNWNEANEAIELMMKNVAAHNKR